jgi:hypothetical protein
LDYAKHLKAHLPLAKTSAYYYTTFDLAVAIHLAALTNPPRTVHALLNKREYIPWFITVRVIGGRGTALFSLEMRAGELIRRLISGELTNYEVVRTSPEPLHTLSATALSK